MNEKIANIQGRRDHLEPSAWIGKCTAYPGSRFHPRTQRNKLQEGPSKTELRIPGCRGHHTSIPKPLTTASEQDHRGRFWGFGQDIPAVPETLPP